METIHQKLAKIFQSLFQSLSQEGDDTNPSLYHEYFLACLKNDMSDNLELEDKKIQDLLCSLAKGVQAELESISPQKEQAITTLSEHLETKTMAELFYESPYDGRTLIWELLCDEALILTKNSVEECIQELQERRKVSIVKQNPNPITNPAQEILFTSNILLTVPTSESLDSLSIPPSIKEKVREIIKEPQQYWYDHPMPIGINREANEMIYGLQGLVNMLEFEKSRGYVSQDASIDVLLSVSVTHLGLSKIAKEYLQYELNQAGEFPGLNVFIVTEDDTAKIADLLQSKIQDHSSTLDDKHTIKHVFGVDGRYGRHYSLLKAIAPLWKICYNPSTRATFKIDLDQIFPQEELLAQSGKSALEHFTTPLWGALAKDNENNEIELGMIAGGLVNESDIAKGLFTPDVPIPSEPLSLEDIVFPKTFLMGISTRAEIMTKYNTDAINGDTTALQRVHVTGGTNGILIDALRKHRAFTPSFIGRAEDQAFLMSVYNSDNPTKLRYLHESGLIMRHDKAAFAGEAIKAAKLGTYVGDLLRSLLFSRYARALRGGLPSFKKSFSPFTSCFSSDIPLITITVRLLLHCLTLDKESTATLLDIAYSSLQEETHSQKKEGEIAQQYLQEKQEWDAYYDSLELIETAHQETRQSIQAILQSCKI